MTNTFTIYQLNLESVKETGQLQGNGGISIYYSHNLQLLFFSFNCNKNFAASFDAQSSKFNKIFSITYKV